MPALFWVLAALLPMVPDFDSFGHKPYGSILGHRGFTHSLIFALAVGLFFTALTFRYFRVPFWDLLGFFFVITASHGILDMFTNGGFGIPLFWPFGSALWSLGSHPGLRHWLRATRSQNQPHGAHRASLGLAAAGALGRRSGGVPLLATPQSRAATSRCSTPGEGLTIVRCMVVTRS